MNCNELSFLFFFLCSFINSLQCTKPHIILIVASDLGFGDIGYHGTSEIPTPNIDALAYSGIMLRNYYVNTFSSHSRSALMTGKYPLYPGWQQDLPKIGPIELPLNETILPQYLKKFGYKNHMVGKWHLGRHKKKGTPLNKGFDSHLGTWTGHQDYYDHTNTQKAYWGFEMRRNFEVAYDLHGKHATDIYTDEAIRIIDNHHLNAPLFLYVAHAAVQLGNRYNPLPATDEEIKEYEFIKNEKRRRYAVMLKKLDESVGRITEALAIKGMLEDSIIVFTGDNGGPCNDTNSNGASNYPFRGCKGTLSEGGIRAPAFIWSQNLKKSKRIFRGQMHIMDWLPTLLFAVEPNLQLDFQKYGFKNPRIDGFNMWKTFLNNDEIPRSTTFHGIVTGGSGYATAVRSGRFKLIYADSEFEKPLIGNSDKWTAESVRELRPDNYKFNAVTSSLAGQALKSIKSLIGEYQMSVLRNLITMNCKHWSYKEYTINYSVCNITVQPCLFDLREDPCEFYNIYDKRQLIIDTLKHNLESYLKEFKDKKVWTLHQIDSEYDESDDPEYMQYHEELSIIQKLFSLEFLRHPNVWVQWFIYAIAIIAILCLVYYLVKVMALDLPQPVVPRIVVDPPDQDPPGEDDEPPPIVYINGRPEIPQPPANVEEQHEEQPVEPPAAEVPEEPVEEQEDEEELDFRPNGF